MSPYPDTPGSRPRNTLMRISSLQEHQRAPTMTTDTSCVFVETCHPPKGATSCALVVCRTSGIAGATWIGFLAVMVATLALGVEVASLAHDKQPVETGLLVSAVALMFVVLPVWVRLGLDQPAGGFQGTESWAQKKRLLPTTRLGGKRATRRGAGWLSCRPPRTHQTRTEHGLSHQAASKSGTLPI